MEQNWQILVNFLHVISFSQALIQVINSGEFCIYTSNLHLIIAIKHDPNRLIQKNLYLNSIYKINRYKLHNDHCKCLCTSHSLEWIINISAIYCFPWRCKIIKYLLKLHSLVELKGIVLHESHGIFSQRNLSSNKNTMSSSLWRSHGQKWKPSPWTSLFLRFVVLFCSVHASVV